jgi:hypothetical protein
MNFLMFKIFYIKIDQKKKSYFLDYDGVIWAHYLLIKNLESVLSSAYM